MANWSGIILTDRGRALQAKVETGVSLNITKFKLGDGIASGALESLLDLVHPLQTVGIGSVKALGGMCEITGVLTNSSVTTGYYLRELGIYAMDPDLGEILYAITTDSAPDYLPPGGGNVVISEEFSINIAISNATNVKAILNPQGLVTTTIMQSAISNHNNDENAHPWLKTLVEKAGAMPIGAIMSFLMKSAPEGWLALDTGALVSRATYPDLWAWVQVNAPLISESEWQIQAGSQSSVGFFSTGDGATTFRLPRIVDYIRGGLLADVGTWQGDAIRNITGSMKEVYSYADSISSANYSGALVGTKTYSTTYNIGIGTNGDSSFDLSFDASRVVPTAEENRPKTIKMVYCIKAFGATTNQGQVDITALANEVADKQKTIQYIQVQDEKPSGTSGGTVAGGAWRTRDLTTIKADDTGIVTLSNNQITLPPGTYVFNCRTPVFGTNQHKCRLQNISDSVTLGFGTNEDNSTGTITSSIARGKFTISATKTIEVQHFVVDTSATSYGSAANIAGVPEIYSTLALWKVN